MTITAGVEVEGNPPLAVFPTNDGESGRKNVLDNAMLKRRNVVIPSRCLVGDLIQLTPIGIFKK